MLKVPIFFEKRTKHFQQHYSTVFKYYLLQHIQNTVTDYRNDHTNNNLESGLQLNRLTIKKYSSIYLSINQVGEIFVKLGLEKEMQGRIKKKFCQF